ncbi:MAG TPA: PilZ domain-containing protein [Bryobacteraceae bacterium]|nr:PilZ domain-containing protein [Bryobacteraceae bacterium]
MERRDHSRVEAELPCRARFSKGGPPAAMGTTVNISRTGMLIQFQAMAGNAAPEKGEFLSIELELPKHRAFERRCLCCEGRVVRVSQEAGRGVRVAIRVSHMEFRGCGERGVSGVLVSGQQFESFFRG